MEKTIVCAYKKKFRRQNVFNIDSGALIQQHRGWAERVTQIKRLASLHYNYRIMAIVREGTLQQIREEFTNYPDFRKDINAVRISNQRNRAQPNQEFQQCMQAYGIDPIPSDLISHIIESVITEYHTSLKNSFKEEAYRRVNRILTAFARDVLHEDDIENEVKKTMKYLFNDINETTEGNTLLLNEYRRILQPICGGRRPPRGWWNDPRMWYEKVPDIINGLFVLKTVNDRPNQRKKFKLFKPLPKFKNVFVHKIRVDTRDLVFSVNEFIERGQKLNTNGQNYNIWEDIFDFSVLERVATDRKTIFDYSIATDGVSVSVKMLQGSAQEIARKRALKGRDAKLKEKKRKAEEAADAPPPKKKITPAENTPEKNLLRKLKSGRVFGSIIQIDPGVKNTLGCVMIDLATSSETNLLITSKYYHHQLKTYLRKERKRPMIRDLHNLISGVHNSYGDDIIPSRKGGNIRIWLDSEMRLFDRYTETYQRRSFSRMRFDAHMCKQKTVDMVTKKVVSMNPNEESGTLIVMGNSQMSRKSPIKGYKKTPSKNYWVKKFEELHNCEVYEIDEFRTTKTCSFCGSLHHVTRNIGHRYVSCKDCYPAGNDAMINEPFEVRTKGKQYWRQQNYRPDRIRTFEYNWNDRMRHRKSRTTNRDINAPRNIGLKAIAKITGREDLLPAALLRPNDND